MVPFRTGVHALPSCAGIVDESGFSDLPEEAIVAKDSSDPHSKHWRGILCVHCHDVFVLIPLFKAVSVLLASIVGVVRSFPSIDMTTAITAVLVGHTLSPTSAITGNTHKTLILLRWLAITCVERV